MERNDVIVVGAGISGLAFAWKAAQAGKRALVLERTGRVGGCIHSERRADGYWFELGAHTAYNSYCAFLDIASGTGAVKKLVGRGPARARFGLVRGAEYRWLSPTQVLLQLDWLEAAARVPLAPFRRRDGQTVYSWYSRLIGRRNYDRVLGPFLAAVPSQSADAFPLKGPGSLFKKRPRRKEYARSFGFEGGLQTVCDAAAGADGVTVRTGVEVRRVVRAGQGYAVETAAGERLEAPQVAVAVPAGAAAAVLNDDFHEAAVQVARVRTVSVDSMAVVLPREKCWMPEVAFVVPVDDVFHSAVTRDPFPDPRLRAFAFHFKPGHPRDLRVKRMAAVLRVPADELGEIFEKQVALPSPALGHADIVREIDRCLAGGRLAVTGNYFAGLAIEDCVLRSNDEWRRVNV